MPPTVSPPKVSPSRKKKGRRRKAKVKKEPRFTKEELYEEIDIFLTTNNPYMSENCVEFDRKTKCFKQIFDFRKPIVYYATTGSAKRKLEGRLEVLYGEEEKSEEERMRNKFNFRSVASQTIIFQPTEASNQIDPSLFPVLTFKSTVSKAEIIAAYKEKETGKKRKEEYNWIFGALKKIKKFIGRKSVTIKEANRKYLRLCERMLDQNMSEANLDFSYYDNPNDEFRPNFGSVLPLWNFTSRQVRNMTVTSITWNSQYIDLFGVGYRASKTTVDGEVEEDDDNLGLMRESGCICVYSLKGPGHPEKMFSCSSAVCCVEFHPTWPHLMAIGFVGGTVSVYDLRRELDTPAGSNLKSEEILHQDAVNEIKWLPDRLPQKFCSVASDGKIINWLFLLYDLFPFEVVTSLRIKDWPKEIPPKGIEMNVEPKTSRLEDMGLRVSGTAISVNPLTCDSFVVGTETGLIHKCSFDERDCRGIYEDHKDRVHNVHWNPFHPRVFLSCSEDLTIRVWDYTLQESVFEFFFENEVKDVSWAPFSSTLFAAISGNAMLYVFDLVSNKLEAIGSYAVYGPKQTANLTVVRFHPTKPILLVGDDRGHVTCFKLSPNLRSSLKAMETLEKSKFKEGEVEKMEKLLAPAKGRVK